MAMILLFKVMVALSVLSWYGAAVLRFINEYFMSQFRKQLEQEFNQHPEMRNLDLEGFHDIVTQFPGEDNRKANDKNDIFVVDTSFVVKQQKQRSVRNGFTLERSGEGGIDRYAGVERHISVGESQKDILYNGRDLDEETGGNRERKTVFSSFESLDPDHYYSILRSSQSGGHGRDQKPQSDFTARTATDANSEWVSMSLSRSEEKREARDNNADVSVGFTREEPQEEKEADSHQNFYPSTRDDGYNEAHHGNVAADHGERTDSFQNCYHPPDFATCNGRRAATSSADLSAEYDSDMQWNDDGYYCSAADGESNGETKHLKSDYYGKDFQDYPMDYVYADSPKHSKHVHAQQLPLKGGEKDEDHNYYHEDSLVSLPTPTVGTYDATMKPPFYDNVMDSSSSLLLSKSSSSFYICLISSLLVVKWL